MLFLPTGRSLQSAARIATTAPLRSAGAFRGGVTGDRERPLYSSTLVKNTRIGDGRDVVVASTKSFVPAFILGRRGRPPGRRGGVLARVSAAQGQSHPASLQARRKAAWRRRPLILDDDGDVVYASEALEGPEAFLSLRMHDCRAAGVDSLAWCIMWGIAVKGKNARPILANAEARRPLPRRHARPHNRRCRVLPRERHRGVRLASHERLPRRVRNAVSQPGLPAQGRASGNADR